MPETIITLKSYIINTLRVAFDGLFPDELLPV